MNSIGIRCAPPPRPSSRGRAAIDVIIIIPTPQQRGRTNACIIYRARKNSIITRASISRVAVLRPVCSLFFFFCSFSISNLYSTFSSPCRHLLTPSGLRNANQNDDVKSNILRAETCAILDGKRTYSIRVIILSRENEFVSACVDGKAFFSAADRSSFLPIKFVIEVQLIRYR